MMKNSGKKIDAGNRTSRRVGLRKLLSGFLAVATAVSMLGGSAASMFAEEASTEYALAGAGSGQDVTVHFGDGEDQDINIHINSETDVEENAVLAGPGSNVFDETEAETESETENDGASDGTRTLEFDLFGGEDISIVHVFSELSLCKEQENNAQDASGAEDVQDVAEVAGNTAENTADMEESANYAGTDTNEVTSEEPSVKEGTGTAGELPSAEIFAADIEDVILEGTTFVSLNKESEKTEDWIIELAKDETDHSGETAVMTVTMKEGVNPSQYVINMTVTGRKEVTDGDLVTIGVADAQAYLPEDAQASASVVDGTESIAAVEAATADKTDSPDQPSDTQSPSEATDVDSKELKEETESISEKNGDDSYSIEDDKPMQTQYQVFDINLDGVDMEQYEEGFKVVINLPEEIKNAGNFHLYHIHDDGTVEEIAVTTTGTVDKKTGLEDVSGFEFVTGGFSEYVLEYTSPAYYDYRALVNDGNLGYLAKAGNKDVFGNNTDIVDRITYNNQITEFTATNGSDGYSVDAKTRNDNCRFAFWFKYYGGAYSKAGKSNTTALTWEGRKPVGNALFVAFFAPGNAKVIVLDTYSNGTVSRSGQIRRPYNRYGQMKEPPEYFYSTDNVTLTANANSGYYFKGWYADGKLLSTNPVLQSGNITSDCILKSVFERAFVYSTVPNESGKGTFHYKAWGRDYDGNSFTRLQTEGVPNKAACSFRFPVDTTAASGYEFAYWLKDDGTSPVTNSDSAGRASILRGFGEATDADPDFNVLTRDTTFVAFFKPIGDYIVRVNDPSEGGYVQNANGLKTVYDEYQNKNIFKHYYAGADRPVLRAVPANGWEFVGWFHNGTELVSADVNFNVYNYVYGDQEGGRRDLNLTPVFRKQSNEYHIWLDGSNGIAGGEAGNNTFFTRITSNNEVIGTSSKLQTVQKNWPYYKLPTDAEAKSMGIGPSQQSDITKFVIQGWYDIYNKKYYNVGERVQITGDTVFYADWAPSKYDIGNNDGRVAYQVDTSSFITTRVFDYNNLFNMQDIVLDRIRSAIPFEQGTGWSDWNKEYWHMKGSADDFVFMSTVSGKGRSLNPYGRTARNSNNETSTNGNQYTGLTSTGILNGALKNRLFSTANDQKNNPGQRYVGLGNYLYNYNAQSGYYYYDSDKNAASYNQSQGRFFAYTYKNSTNKSDASDQADFLPFNYGERGFTEAWSEPNYWFGMTSEIDFFLPNAPGYQDNNGNYGNKSVHGDNMVYKFAGDDDVWVFVDGQLVLDMGGVHGKVYGEIDFSTGQWKIIGDGATRTTTRINGTDFDIIDYEAGTGSVLASGTLSDLGINTEGDHTLTLYYLERGASQSNCAIYFNLAPRYGLQIHKVDGENNTNAGMSGAQFAVYTDESCSLPADITDSNNGIKTNVVTTDSNGYAVCTGLTAGHTYYIKEIKAPGGYPDVSGETFKLTLDANGQAQVSCTTPALIDSQNISQPNPTGGVFQIGLTIKNYPHTSVTVKKDWGKVSSPGSDASATIRLKRYYLKTESTAGDSTDGVKVAVVERYFADPYTNAPVATSDGASLVVFRATEYVVAHGGSLVMAIQPGNNNGIYAVSPEMGVGGIVASNVQNTNTKPFTVNQGKVDRPYAGTYTLWGAWRDTTVYVTYIGGSMPSTPISFTNRDASQTPIENTGSTLTRVDDTNYVQFVTLSSNNGWKHEWSSLPAAVERHPDWKYYYYVEETAASLNYNGTVYQLGDFIVSCSSNGVNSGTITVQNQIKTKLKLRKRSSERDSNGKEVHLPGAEFRLYTAEEYAKAEAGRMPLTRFMTAEWMEEDLFKTAGGGSKDPNESIMVSTDNSQYPGVFYIGYLPDGEYVVEEVTPPSGYIITQKVSRIKVENGKLSYQTPQGGWNEKKPNEEKYVNFYIDNRPCPGLNLKKVNESTRPENAPVDQNTRYLDGAEFTISKWDGTSYQSYTPMLTTGQAQSTVATMNGGQASFSMIGPGEYRIVESKVPAGFVKLSNNDIYFKVEYDSNGSQIITRYKTPMTTTEVSGEIVEVPRKESDRIPADQNDQSSDATMHVTFTPASSGSVAEFIIGNLPGAVLPATGGAGTRIIYMLGALLLLLAGGMLLLQRRRVKEM